MTKIKVRKNESFEQALRRFQRMVMKSGVIDDYKDRVHHVTKSEKRRLKKKELARKIYLENKYRR